MENEMKIYVFADFLTYQNDLIGIIYVSQTRGKEFCSFEYDGQWLEKQEAIEIAERMKDIVKNNWRVFAKKYRISRGEIERMQPAFQICE